VAIEPIKQGYEVFLADGEPPFGSVLHVRNAKEFTICVEDAGEFVVPTSAVKAVHAEKVILNRTKLGLELQEAIKHAHDEEDDNLHLGDDDTDIE